MVYAGKGKMRSQTARLGAGASSGTSIGPDKAGDRLIIREVTPSCNTSGARIGYVVNAYSDIASGTTHGQDISSTTGVFPAHINEYSLDADQSLYIWGDGNTIAVNIIAEQLK